jgi:hypothetical protein
MPLLELKLPIDPTPPPRAVRLFLAEATRRIEEFQDRGGCHGFVPSDYSGAYHALQSLTENHAPGALFCEWGSGFGVVACLAAMLGFDAHGIEVRSELVEAARNLADDHDLAVEFMQGSFIPEGGEACLDADEDYAWLTTEAHAHPELAPDDFDVTYGYPWPDEERLIADLFERFARPGALLLTHHGGDGFRLRRKAAERTHRRAAHRRR